MLLWHRAVFLQHIAECILQSAGCDLSLGEESENPACLFPIAGYVVDDADFLARIGRGIQGGYDRVKGAHSITGFRQDMQKGASVQVRRSDVKYNTVQRFTVEHGDKIHDAVLSFCDVHNDRRFRERLPL